jgi:hypothetical protein
MLQANRNEVHQSHPYEIDMLYDKFNAAGAGAYVAEAIVAEPTSPV